MQKCDVAVNIFCILNDILKGPCPMEDDESLYSFRSVTSNLADLQILPFLLLSSTVNIGVNFFNSLTIMDLNRQKLTLE